MIYFNGTDSRTWERAIELMLKLPQDIPVIRKVEFLSEDLLCFLDKLKITDCDNPEEH